MAFLKEVSLFIWAVVNNWAGYSTGGAIVAIVALWHLIKDKPVPRKLGLSLALFFFVLSFFKAWQDQYRRAEQLAKNANAPSAIQVNVPPAQVQVNVPPPVVNFPPQMAYMALTEIGIVSANYRIGGNVVVSAACKNISPSIIAEKVGCVRALRVVATELNSLKQPIVPESVQETSYSQFQKDIASIEVDRRSYGPGESFFGSVLSPAIDEQLDNAFRSESKTVLFLAKYSWKDPSGDHVNEVCTWLQVYPGLFAGPGALATNATITWNGCRNHNGLKR